MTAGDWTGLMITLFLLAGLIAWQLPRARERRWIRASHPNRDTHNEQDRHENRP